MAEVYKMSSASVAAQLCAMLRDVIAHSCPIDGN